MSPNEEPKSQGWMSQLLEEQRLLPSKREFALILKLETIDKASHRLTPQRISWLCKWLGALKVWELEERIEYLQITTNSDESQNTAKLEQLRSELEAEKRTFDELYLFLSKVWTHKQFQPFETIVDLRAKNLRSRDVIRLSSTCPAYITVSSSSSRNKRNIIYSRYPIIRSKIFMNGKYYSDISNFIESLSICDVTYSKKLHSDAFPPLSDYSV